MLTVKLGKGCGVPSRMRRVCRAGGATVSLLLITIWADEEKGATARRATKALPKGGLTIIRYVNTGQQGQPRTKIGNCWLTRTCASEAEHSRKNTDCLRNRGFIFCSRAGMLTKGEM